jgi:hypothetical protein
MLRFDPKKVRHFLVDSDSDSDEKLEGLSKARLLQIFRESTDVYQAPLQSHGLRHDRFQEWVQRHPSERLREYAQLIYDNSRYVSHSEFFSRYDLIADELLYIIDTHRRKGGKINVVLYLGMPQIKKSNFWILLYLLSRMSRVVDYIITPEDAKNLPPRTLLIIPDDAIYSGKQMYSQLDRLYRNTKDATVVIASAFISKMGRELLKPFGVQFPVYSDSFDVTVLPKDIYVYNQPATPLHTIYFDHKLADMVSIYQTIYALGVGLSDEEDLFPYEPMSLIDNCDPPQLVYQYFLEIEPVDYGLQETVEYFLTEVLKVDINDYIEICPFSPYKKRVYTLEGRPLLAL